jgi:pentatricopeptide repeat protein
MIVSRILSKALATARISTLPSLEKGLPIVRGNIRYDESSRWISRFNSCGIAQETRRSFNAEKNVDVIRPSQPTTSNTAIRTDTKTNKITHRFSSNKITHRFSSLGRVALQAETDRFIEILQNPTPQSKSSSDSAYASSEPSSSSRRRYTSQECYHLLEAWRNIARDTQQVGAARQAEEILAALENNAATTRFLKPTSLFYDLVLQAYVVSNGVQAAAEMAENLLQRMSHGTSPSTIPKPTTKSYNIVLNGWAKSGANNAGSKAEALFHAMQESLQGSQPSIVPNVRTLTSVIEAWANSGHAQASERIMAILHVVVDQHRQFQNGADARSAIAHVIQLDVAVFNAAIRALSRTEPNRRGAEMAEYVLRMLTDLCEAGRDRKPRQDQDHFSNPLSPTTQTYSMVLHAWAQCEVEERRGDASARAEKILDFMIYQYSTRGWNVKPNAKSFTSCIAAWSRCAGSRVAMDAPERAEKLLDRLHQLYLETGDFELQPDTSACNAVLSSWSRSRRQDAPRRAEEAFSKLHRYGAVPDLISYNCLLHAYSTVGNPIASRHLLDWMIEQNQSTVTVEMMKPMPWSTLTPPTASIQGDFHKKIQDQQQQVVPPMPDVVSYNSVLNGLAKSGAAEQAIELLDQMERLATDSVARNKRAPATRQSNMQPNHVTYTSVIHAIGNAKDCGVAAKAYAIYQRMLARQSRAATPDEEKRLRPDTVIVVAVIQACAREGQDKAGALRIAQQLFGNMFVPSRLQEYGEGVTPFHSNELTFVTMLDACNQLASSDEEWEDLVHNVMERCRDSGYVSRRVLDMLRRGLRRQNLTQDRYRNMEQRVLGLEGDHIKTGMPRSSTRNVLPRNRPQSPLQI